MPTAACRSRPARTTWLAERRFALDEGLRRLAAAARAGATTGGSIEDSVLRAERTETAVPVTLYRYVGPQGQLREQGRKVLGS